MNYRRVLVAIAACLIFPNSSALAQISFIKNIGTVTSTSTGTTTAITVPVSGVAAGNRVFVLLGMNPSTGTVTCNDSGGNSYAVDRDVANGSGTSGVRTVILSAQVATALVSGNTITCTHPSVTARALSANEFSGLATTAAVDKIASATGNNAAPSSGATSTTTQASELLIGAIGVEGPTTETFTAAANYTAIGRAGTSGGTSANNITMNPEYRIVSAAGAYSASGTLSASRKWATAIVTYKAESTGTPTKLSITSVNSGAIPSAGIGFPVVVQAQDTGGIPRNVTNATGISLVLKTGTGVLGGTLTGTIAAGTNQVTISGVTYTKAQSGVVITANRTSGDGLVSGDSSAFTVNAGPAAKLAFLVQPADSTAGTPIPGPPSVVVQDSFGNTVISSNTSITLTLDSNPVGGQLFGTTAKSAVSGTASFSGISIDKAYYPYSLTAASTGLVGATSNPFEIEPGPASRLTIYPIDEFATPTAGNGFEVLVIPTDAYDNKAHVNALTGVSLALKTGTGTLGGTLTGSIPAGEKELYFFGVTYTKAESGIVLTATRTSGDTLSAGDSAGFVVSPAAAAKVAFTTQPGNTAAGSTLAGPPTVSVQDNFGNTVTTSTNTITVAVASNPGGGTLSGTTTRNANFGVAAFTGLSINQVANGYTLAATSTGLASATSSAFNIIAGSGGLGIISGFVTRVSDGTSVSGALIEVFQGVTLVATANTTASGSYSIGGLVDGVYAVRASSAGFVPRVRENIVIVNAAPVTVNLSLNFGIAIYSPLAGIVVNEHSVLVTGEFDTTLAPEVGITVNAVPARIDIESFSAVVAVGPQTASLTATVVNSAGTALATETIPITAEASAPTLTLQPRPAEGVAPLTVTFDLTSLVPIVQVSLDSNGDGAGDFQGSTLLGQTFIFQEPGVYHPAVTVTSDGGAIYSAVASVQVYNTTSLEALLQQKWQGFKNALRAGNTAAALLFLAQDERVQYQAMFQNLSVPLSSIDQILTDIQFVQAIGNTIEYKMLRTDARGQLSYIVRFVLDKDGIWRIQDL